MASLLDSYLTLVERDPNVGSSDTLADRASAVDERVAVHTALFEVMERRLGPNGLTAAHRSMIPLYQRWITVARRIVTDARELRKAGQQINGVDELVRAINYAKPVAEDFEETVAMNERISRGEPGTYVPLDEIRNEIRS